MKTKSLALGLAFILTIGFPTGADPGDATIRLGTDPEPPVQVPNPGGQVTIFWEVQCSTTPDYVLYRLIDPNSVVMEELTYPGSTGLNIPDHLWVVPEGALGGSHLVRVEFYSIEQGNEANAEVVFWVGQPTATEISTWARIKELFR